MRFFPSWHQFKRWSLPSRLTLIGAYAGVVSLALAISALFLPSNLQSPDRRGNEVGRFVLSDRDDARSFMTFVSDNKGTNVFLNLDFCDPADYYEIIDGNRSFELLNAEGNYEFPPSFATSMSVEVFYPFDIIGHAFAANNWYMYYFNEVEREHCTDSDGFMLKG